MARSPWASFLIEFESPEKREQVLRLSRCEFHFRCWRQLAWELAKASEMLAGPQKFFRRVSGYLRWDAVLKAPSALLK